MVTIDSGEWLQGAGQFNMLEADSAWDAIEAMVRKGPGKLNHMVTLVPGLLLAVRLAFSFAEPGLVAGEVRSSHLTNGAAAKTGNAAQRLFGELPGGPAGWSLNTGLSCAGWGMDRERAAGAHERGGPALVLVARFLRVPWKVHRRRHSAERDRMVNGIAPEVRFVKRWGCRQGATRSVGCPHPRVVKLIEHEDPNFGVLATVPCLPASVRLAVR